VGNCHAQRDVPAWVTCIKNSSGSLLDVDDSSYALGGWLTRRFHWLWGALAGYGYRTRRTALALLIAAGSVAVWAGYVPTGPGQYAAEHTITTPAPRTPCSTVEFIGLGVPGHQVGDWTRLMGGWPLSAV
jgi:hypothetical protein